MPREDKQTKSRRLVSEGRLRLGWMDNEKIVAVCTGDQGLIYEITWNVEEGYRCDCEARTECSHILALKLVTVSPVTMMKRVNQPDLFFPKGVPAA